MTFSIVCMNAGENSVQEEFSAGGVVLRHKLDTGWELLLIQDMNENWTFPKGIVEPGEDEVSGAKREIAEETGVQDLTFIKSLQPITYWYVRDGRKVKKTVQYFLFSSEGQDELKAQKNEGISHVAWVEIKRVKEIIGYKETNGIIVDEAASYFLHTL